MSTSPQQSRLVRRIVEVAGAVLVTAVAGILFGYLNRPAPELGVAAPLQARETPVDEVGVRFVRSEPPRAAQPTESAAQEPAPAPRAAPAKPAVAPARKTAAATERTRAEEPLPLAPANAPRNVQPVPIPPSLPAAAPPPEQTRSGSNVLAAFRRIPGWFLPSSSPSAAPSSPAVELPPRPPRPVGNVGQDAM